MPVAQERFRNALRKFASGTTIVTVERNGEPHGMTASSFASVSLDPPLILVCLDVKSKTRSILQETKWFCVNILAADQEWMAKAFSLPGKKPFDKLEHRPTGNGLPIIGESIAWLECEVRETISAGDHDVVIGAVTDCDADERDPLLHYDRRYSAFRRP